MSRFIDKRPNGRHKSALNRQRFMRRFKSQIQSAVRQAISGRSIKQVDTKGESVNIPTKDITEPSFSYGHGGKIVHVLPGNREFLPGDKIKRETPEASQGGGSDGSNSPETGLDEFVFEISKDEFLDIFFEDLALPNLIKTQIQKTPTFKMVRAGFTKDGVPSNINIIRTMRDALGRRIIMGGEKKKRLKRLEAELETLEKNNSPSDKITELKAEIETVKKALKKIPFIDPYDVRYNYRVRQALPATQAVMFCLMDVSGSMDEAKKDIAKRFFILLYLFLSKSYESVEVVFIRHHTSAKEVNEEEFFYSRETGGTVVSSALELMSEIIEQRYPTADWNIYAAQASDGDNWNNDSPHCEEILLKNIMPHMQYFAYVEIMPRNHQSLWDAYLHVKSKCPQFAMQHIEDVKDIYPVFRELFKESTDAKPVSAFTIPGTLR